MKVMFGAGCFWQVQFAFDKIENLITIVGYSGGDKENPTYEEVCTGLTGHAEVVLVEYDEKEISFEKLLGVFFNVHNPTELNKQGPDIGSQYRSVIFYFNEEQKKIIEKRIKKEQKNYVEKIVTLILPAKKFFKAEEYHQKYIEKKSGYC